VRRMGRFRFFRKPFEPTLWPLVTRWIHADDNTPETA
jgi:predicted alpha/beta hydrolase